MPPSTAITNMHMLNPRLTLVISDLDIQRMVYAISRPSRMTKLIR